ncbi:chromosome segregation ATPase [Natrinema halophilum]|uniref:Chromosome segregation ATPase n=1 Tax=Natrinema halophilum TaxID=1699371 RepID=A0A7D5KMK8_9EURY|nr:chromosome segregation ATPase [Natrinema halophilum]QLG50818.1 chromosome segregation ATPase [Natrinema halophilum]
MNYGLDIGPGSIRAATDTGDGRAIQSAPPIVQPADDDALEETGLSRDGAIVRATGTTYAVGNAAQAVADAAGEDPQLLFANGRLETAADAPTTAALETLVDELLGEATGGRLCYTTPGSLVDVTESADAYREAIESVVAHRGLDATPISKGFAVVYDQFGADNYTGLGVCLEAQTTSVTLAYYGVPAMAVTIGKGREWIVERTAGETGHAATQVAGVLEDFTLDPDAPADGIESGIAEAYDDLIADLIETVRDEADESDIQQGLSVPLAIAGEGAIQGIEFLFGGRFDSANLPFSIRGVRLADAPEESAARGALAAARANVEADKTITRPDGADQRDDADGGSSGPESSTEDVGTELTFDDSAIDDTIAAQSDTAIEQLFDRLATRDSEIQSVREDLEDLFADLEYVEERMAAADDVEGLDDRLETFADELADLEAESETHASNEDVEILDDDLANLSDALAELEDDVDEVDTALEAVETDAADERAILEDRLGDLAGDLEEIDARTETLDDDLAALSAALEQLEADAAAESALEEVEETVSRLTNDLEELEATVDRTETRVEGFAGRLEELATRIDDVSGHLEEEFERSDERADAIEATLDAVDEELTAVNKTLSARAESLEQRLETARDTIEALETAAVSRDRVDAVEDNLSDLETAVEDIEQAIAGATERLDDVAARTASTETVDELADTIGTVESNLEAIESDLRVLEERFEQRIDDAITDLETERSEVVAGLEADLDELDDEIVMDDDLEALRESVAETDEMIDVVTDDIDGITAELEAIERKVDELDDAPSSDAVVALENDVARLEDDVSEIANRFESLRTEYDELDRAADSGPDESAVQALEEVRTLDATVDELDERVTAVVEGHTNLEQQVETIDGRLGELEQQNPPGEVIEGVRTELEVIRADAMASPSLSSAIIGGGGGAGVVAGCIAALTGDVAVGGGAAVVGFVLIGVSLFLDR